MPGDRYTDPVPASTEADGLPRRFQEVERFLSHIYVGSGAPEGVVSAPVASLFLRVDGGSTSVLYVKELGSGSTGWVSK